MEYELYHYGRPHDNAPGRGSGRYAWGSGKKEQKRVLTAYKVKGNTYAVRDNQQRKAEKIDAGIKVLNEAGKAVPNAASVSRGAYGLKRASRSYDLSNMSDADLQKAINRMNLEQNYKNLKNSDINNGESKVNAWLGITGGVVGIASSAATIGYIIWKMANKK